MKLNISVPVIMGGAVLLAATSCVPMKKFKAMEKARMECDSTLASVSAQKRDLESLKARLEEDTTSCGRRYRNLLAEKEYMEDVSTAEKKELESRLGQTGSELTEKERLLAERERKLKELQDLVSKQEAMVTGLRKRVADALVGFKSDELSVEMRNGKVYVSLSEKLLFKSGSAAVDPKGKEALGKLAGVLEKNPDIDVMIEGHTDNVPLLPGKFDDNWDLSVSRATSIVRILTQDNKLDPKRVIASGRSEYMPVESNETTEGRAKNRRTEIILTPKLDELYKLLESK